MPNNKNLGGKIKSISCNEGYFENAKTHNESILNINRADFPPCKHKQKMALSALSILSNLRKQLEKPRQPVSLLLNHVVQYGEKFNYVQSSGTIDNATAKNKLRKVRVYFLRKWIIFIRKLTKNYYDVQVSPKVLDELIKETGVLVVPEPSRWKWESVRILLKVRRILSSY